MSIYCQQCGVENEDNSKFCKSCGAALNIEPKKTVDTEKSINPNTTMQTVKKVAIWIGMAILAFMSVVILINFIHDKREDSKIRELRNGCANNDAQACYELGILDYFGNGMFNSEKKLDYDENKEALAKGCQLNNKNACREGGYDERGCELGDGESCFNLASYGSKNPKVVSCQIFPESTGCKKILEERAIYEKKYTDLACQYGYSQGCIQQ